MFSLNQQNGSDSVLGIGGKRMSVIYVCVNFVWVFVVVVVMWLSIFFLLINVFERLNSCFLLLLLFAACKYFF